MDSRVVIGCGAAAFGAETQQAVKAPSEAIFVAQIVALLLVGRLFGEIMLRLGQPAVVGQLLAGIALGPSVFGLLLPQWHDLVFPVGHAQKAMIDGVGQLGVLMLLLLTGMETDVALVRSVGKPAVSVSITGIAVPFVCGISVGLFLLPDALLPSPDKRLVTALFLGTALSISSIKIVAMVIDEMHFMRRNLGQIIVASAIIDDTIGWIIVAVIVRGGAAGRAELRRRSRCRSAARWRLHDLQRHARPPYRGGRAMRWSNDRLVSDLPTITTILVIMGLMALVDRRHRGSTRCWAPSWQACWWGSRRSSPGMSRRELRGLVIALFAPDLLRHRGPREPT